MCYNVTAQIHKPRRRGGKERPMSDIEDQAVQLFNQLTHEQKLAFIRRVQAQPSQDQKELPSDDQETAPGTTA